MMVKNDLVELSLRNGDVEVNLRRPNPVGTTITTLPTMTAIPAGLPLPIPSTPHATAPPQPAEVVDVEYHEIRSPMVGTFYAGPDPDSPPFVTIGKGVSPSTVVCVLEAMKVFSEIKAETSGVIDRVLVKDGDAVEYGQPLFLVRPG
ncbi:MAG: acetyl-CoA carboxylase biotin carboxyl carrier protein [Planctomycetes bacterium]|nr:acetyl-CoA carboxylase biotin carboxyl carrier protein [Planctomycetota bacterium]MBI3836105.1 acetyl-CoA carboxylase biotin carboxyl carrier protein [Planctomycetota bacterium]